MLEDHLGNLWIGTFDGGLVAEVNGLLRTVLNSSSTGTFTSLAEDADHSIWAEFAGSDARPIRIEDFQVREEFKQPQLPAAYSVIADPHGGVWSSLYDGSLRHYHKGKWQTLSTAALVRKYLAIFNMSTDPDGTLWGAASGGVVGNRDGSGAPFGWYAGRRGCWCRRRSSCARSSAASVPGCVCPRRSALLPRRRHRACATARKTGRRTVRSRAGRILPAARSEALRPGNPGWDRERLNPVR